MKRLTTLALSLISTALIAQIPNPSFETWSSGTPTGWKNQTSSIPGSITQVTTAHAGTYAVQLNSVMVGPTYIGGVLTTNSASTFVVNSGNFAALNGWYMLTANGGDQLEIGVATKCPNDSANGAGISFISTGTAVYKQFSICMAYPKACTSDSMAISFYLFSFSGATHAGSFAVVDDLSFGACVSGVDEIGTQVKLEEAYPNPAKTTCNIIYSIPGNSTVNVSLYDISGRKVANLLDDTKQTQGRYKLPVDVSALPNGIYIYRVVVDGVPYAQKLTVEK